LRGVPHHQGSDRQVDADILAKCILIAKGKNRLAQEFGKLTVDAPIPYLLSDLTQILQLEMGKMDKATDTGPYLRLKSKIDEIKGDPRYAFMFSGMLVADTMANFLARVFRLPGDGKPISIIDVSGVPSEITSVVVAVLSRMVFDFAIWSRGEAKRPVLLVCEEAHRYVPNERNADGSSVGRILSRIAKEGRKYGVSLGLITQRPSDLAEGVLSQCGTILSMRLNNERDQAFVKAAMPEGARGFLDSIPALRNRECIAVGEGVATPIRLLFDTLDEGKRPALGRSALLRRIVARATGGEEQMLERTIKRWRFAGEIIDFALDPDRFRWKRLADPSLCPARRVGRDSHHERPIAARPFGRVRARAGGSPPGHRYCPCGRRWSRWCQGKRTIAAPALPGALPLRVGAFGTRK
jgi:hypothetical protein